MEKNDSSAWFNLKENDFLQNDTIIHEISKQNIVNFLKIFKAIVLFTINCPRLQNKRRNFVRIFLLPPPKSFQSGLRKFPRRFLLSSSDIYISLIAGWRSETTISDDGVTTFEGIKLSLKSQLLENEQSSQVNNKIRLI